MESVTISLRHYNELRDFMLDISEKSRVIWKDYGGTYYALPDSSIQNLLKDVEDEKIKLTKDYDSLYEAAQNVNNKLLKSIEEKDLAIRELESKLRFEGDQLKPKTAFNEPPSIHVKYLPIICAIANVIGFVVGYLLNS